MFWAIINATLSAIAGGFLAYILIKWPTWFIGVERFGIGILGAGLVMNIAPILGNGGVFGCNNVTPFDNWSGTLIRAGVAIFFIGKARRIRRHEWNNARFIEQGRRELEGRGR